MKKTFLIVTADDFGCSHAVNQAVEQAASEGILTSTSLMITGKNVDEALSIARNTPTLQTSLHLALTEVQPVSSIPFTPFLTAKNKHFIKSPAFMGWGIQLSRTIYEYVKKEVHEQFKAFSQTELPFDHADCHHHLYIHPRLFDITIKNAHAYNLKSLRIPYEPWHISGTLSQGYGMGNWFYRHVFTYLTLLCREKIKKTELIAAQGVFGLYQTGQIDEQWLLMLLDRLKGTGGVYELYTHPSMTSGTQGRRELDGLMSCHVIQKIKDNNIQLIGYRDIEAAFYE